MAVQPSPARTRCRSQTCASPLPYPHYRMPCHFFEDTQYLAQMADPPPPLNLEHIVLV